MSMILVVDDEEGVRALFEQVLTSEGYQVMTAANGKEALRVLRERNLDLVITDLVMPEVEGIETIQKIRREQPALKIIAVSGAFGGQFLDNAKKLGASATLQKPISPDDLLTAVQRVLS